jgi:hypothetical protein
MMQHSHDHDHDHDHDEISTASSCEAEIRGSSTAASTLCDALLRGAGMREEDHEREEGLPEQRAQMTQGSVFCLNIHSNPR